MPVHAPGPMPGGIVHNEQLAYVTLFWQRLRQFIEKKLKDVGVHAIDDHTEQLPALRTDRADHVLANVIAQIGHRTPPARLYPAAARTGISFDTAFIAEPQLDIGVGC